MQLQLVCFALVLTTAYCMVCTSDICSQIKCSAVGDCIGRVDLHGGGVCGCCPRCIPQVGEGEECISSILLLGVPQTFECVSTLFCNVTSRHCQKKPCPMYLKEVQDTLTAAIQSGHPLIGGSSPRCDNDGTYSPVQCSGAGCYCSSKEGEHLYSDPQQKVMYTAHIWQTKGMNCQCAVKQHEYMKSGLLGKLFSCSSNGNYKRTGCTGSVCFCTDENGKQVGTSTVNISQQDKLNC